MTNILPNENQKKYQMIGQHYGPLWEEAMPGICANIFDAFMFSMLSDIQDES